MDLRCFPGRSHYSHHRGRNHEHHTDGIHRISEYHRCLPAEHLACDRERAFSSCNSLQEIVIPDGAEEIRDKAFFNSYSLKKIYIPASVTKIRNGILMSGNSNLVIYGEKGSAAEKYAEKWQITFEEDSSR